MGARSDEQESECKSDTIQAMITSCRSLSKYENISIRTVYPQILATIIAGSFHIVFGISLAFSAILIPKLEDPQSDIVATTTESSTIASVVVLSIPVGCIVAGPLMESIGRINTITLAALPFVAGWIIIAMAHNVWMIIVGRIFIGLGCALGTSPALVYIAEVSHPDLRGALISTAPALASFGMLLVYVKGSFMTWRQVAWSGIAYSVVPLILTIFFVPESPVWLVAKGRFEDAADSLRYLYKGYSTVEDNNRSLSEMRLKILIRENESKTNEKQHNSSKLNVNEDATESFFKRKVIREFCKPSGYKPMVILFLFFLIQQFSGIYITLFYAVTFFQEMGTNVNAYTASIYVGVIRFIMSIANMALLKRFKRRPLVMVSAIVMAVSMFTSGLYTLWIKQGTTTITWLPVLCLLIYVAFSMFGLLTIPWTMTAELFPTSIRGIAHSISYSTAYILMFFAIQCYRPISAALGGSHAVQWLFAAVSILGFLFGWFILPETHQKKLIDIENHFMGIKKQNPKSESTDRQNDCNN